MIIENISIQKLVPSAEGMVLTDGTFYSETPIYLACNDDASRYYEITLEEYAAYLAQKSEEAELEEE